MIKPTDARVPTLRQQKFKLEPGKRFEMGAAEFEARVNGVLVRVEGYNVEFRFEDSNGKPVPPSIPTTSFAFQSWIMAELPSTQDRLEQRRRS